MGYFANSVSIELRFLGLTQRSHQTKNPLGKKKSSQLKEKTITTLLKSKEVQDDFVLDFLKMYALSNILLPTQNEVIHMKAL